MKSILFAATLMLSLSSFAQVKKEFDENVEKRCFQEAKTLGCVKNDTENSSCLKAKKPKLTQDCKDLLDAKASS